MLVSLSWKNHFCNICEVRSLNLVTRGSLIELLNYGMTRRLITAHGCRFVNTSF